MTLRHVKQQQAISMPAKKEVATTVNQPPALPPIFELIANSTMEVAQIEKLMDLHDRHERRQAEKAFNLAMSKFRGLVEAAGKSAKNTHLKTTYATLDDIALALQKPCADCGLNWTFETIHPAANQIRVTCHLTHEDGYSISTSLESPIFVSKGLNPLQGLGFTQSYLKRYTLCAITGIPTGEDTDGENLEAAPADSQAAVEYITQGQYDGLIKMVEDISQWERHLKAGKLMDPDGRIRIEHYENIKKITETNKAKRDAAEAKTEKPTQEEAPPAEPAAEPVVESVVMIETKQMGKIIDLQDSKGVSDKKLETIMKKQFDVDRIQSLTQEDATKLISTMGTLPDK